MYYAASYCYHYDATYDQGCFGEGGGSRGGGPGDGPGDPRNFQGLGLNAILSQAAFHMGPGWAPVGHSWAPVGPRLGPTGAHLGMLLGLLAIIIHLIPNSNPCIPLLPSWNPGSSIEEVLVLMTFLIQNLHINCPTYLYYETYLVLNGCYGEPGEVEFVDIHHQGRGLRRSLSADILYWFDVGNSRQNLQPHLQNVVCFLV